MSKISGMGGPAPSSGSGDAQAMQDALEQYLLHSQGYHNALKNGQIQDVTHYLGAMSNDMVNLGGLIHNAPTMKGRQALTQDLSSVLQASEGSSGNLADAVKQMTSDINTYVK